MEDDASTLPRTAPIIRPIQCPSCPLRHSPARLYRTPARLAEIRASQLAGRFHVCHTEGLDLHRPEAPDILCKGAMDYLRRKSRPF